VWIPGSYLVREFARHLIAAARPSKAVANLCTVRSWTRPPGKWPSATGSAALTVQYEVYAFDTSVRAAFLDASRGFFNGTSCAFV
jgi:predicted metalloprotease with PDZ domain